MILRGDFYLAGAKILDRMIRAMMSKIQFVGFSSQREAENLMPEADAEHRLLAEDAFHRLARIRQRGGIAGAIGKKNPVGIVREDFPGGGCRGQHLDPKARRGQPPQNVQLDSVVERDNQWSVAQFLAQVAIAGAQLPLPEVPVVGLAA